jgi:alpha-tubulin suppressor-like RCC1 family protein
LLGVCFARAVAAGAAHTCALASTGSLYAFGSNQDGQLGVPAETCALGAATATPALVEFPWDDEDEDEDDELAPSSSSAGGTAFKTSTFVKEVSCGARHTACVTTQRELVSWGWNKYGQLGVGDLRTRAAPTRVATEQLAGREAEAVACGRWHTVVGVARSGSARDAVRLD